MITIKELEIEGKPCKEDDGYLTALSDVLGLIDEDIRRFNTDMKLAITINNFEWQIQLKAKIEELEELKARITG